MDKRNESWNFLIYFEKQSATEQMASLDSTKYLEKEIANLYKFFLKTEEGRTLPHSMRQSINLIPKLDKDFTRKEIHRLTCLMKIDMKVDLAWKDKL